MFLLFLLRGIDLLNLKNLVNLKLCDLCAYVLKKNHELC
jgi:hypothetical protein